MQVKDLKEILENYDPEMIVLVDEREGGYTDPEMKVKTVFKLTEEEHKSTYCGEYLEVEYYDSEDYENIEQAENALILSNSGD